VIHLDQIKSFFARNGRRRSGDIIDVLGDLRDRRTKAECYSVKLWVSARRKVSNNFAYAVSGT
jgi:hypothetical protein